MAGNFTRLRVVLVSPVWPFPSDNGKKVALAGFVRYFCERVGHENFWFLRVGDEPGSEQKVPFRIVSIPLPAAYVRVASAGVRSLILHERCVQESLLYSRGLERKLRAAIEDIRPDVIIVDTIRMGQFFTSGRDSGRWVLYLEDLFSRRYQMMLDWLDRGEVLPDPLGAFSYAVPKVLHWLARRQSPQRYLLRLERDLAAFREVELARKFGVLALVNPSEAEAVRASSPGCQVFETPPYLEAPGVHRSNEVALRRRFIVLGSLDYLPNAVGARVFLKKCMPEIARKFRDFQVRFIGRCRSPGLLMEIKSWEPHCVHVGYVANLHEELAEATAMVVPVEIGSGPKIKTLEALGFGLPMITTSNGVEAIPVVSGRECLVSDDLCNFPGLMDRLCDPIENQMVSQNALAFFAKRYSRQAVFSAYDAAFLGL